MRMQVSGLTYLLQGKFEEAAAAAHDDAADWARLTRRGHALVGVRNGFPNQMPRSPAWSNALARLLPIRLRRSMRIGREGPGVRMAGARAPATRSGLDSLLIDPLLANLHDDPRWTAFVRTMGLADDQLK